MGRTALRLWVAATVFCAALSAISVAPARAGENVRRSFVYTNANLDGPNRPPHILASTPRRGFGLQTPPRFAIESQTPEPCRNGAGEAERMRSRRRRRSIGRIRRFALSASFPLLSAASFAMAAGPEGERDA